MKRWYVITPEYGTVIPVLDTGEGPMEYGCDVIEIEAETAKDAVALGVKVMLEDKWCPDKYIKYKWCRNKRKSGECPYTGVRAQIHPEFCEKREDTMHCNCWYDGNKCCACGANDTNEIQETTNLLGM